MNSYIKELYAGNLNAEWSGEPGDEYSQASEKANEYNEKLWGSLNEEQRKLLEGYYDALMKTMWISEQNVFEKGFRIGARLMLEVLQER